MPNSKLAWTELGNFDRILLRRLGVKRRQDFCRMMDSGLHVGLKQLEDEGTAWFPLAYGKVGVISLHLYASNWKRNDSPLVHLHIRPIQQHRRRPSSWEQAHRGCTELELQVQTGCTTVELGACCCCCSQRRWWRYLHSRSRCMQLPCFVLMC